MAEQEEPVRRRVALKIIKLGMDTKEVVARFEAERQALALMDHPNIAGVFDGGATETGRPYFVMELVKGIPITRFCDERKLTTGERLELFMQVCHAVQHAHQKGIIHRDLKPSNILVTVRDDRPVPKVIDFGVAKATQARLTQKTLFTRLQQWIGTPAYMSPEQAGLGSLDVDTRSDIYSLGVLLYELLTGRTPFDTEKLLATGYEAVMRTIREEDPPKPSTRLSTLAEEELKAVAARRGAEAAKLGRLVRGDLDWIVMKALEKDRARRYETSTDFARDIQRHLGSEPVSAAAPGVVYRAKKFARRNRPRLAFAALAVVAVALAAVAAKFALNLASERQDFVAKGTNTVFALAQSDAAKALGRLLDTNPRLLAQRDSGGATPLHSAAQAGSTNVLRLLLGRGAPVDATNSLGWTPLIQGAARGHLDTVDSLLKAGANPDHADNQGITALSMASILGSVEVGRLLLAKGARVDSSSPRSGWNPLSLAAREGNAAFAELLLAYGAGADTKDAEGNTPLHNAASGFSTTNFLDTSILGLVDPRTNRLAYRRLAFHAEVVSNEMTRFRARLPAIALRHGGEHRRVAELLLARGADLEATNGQGCTPLLLATLFTNLPVATVLVAHKANVNARAPNGLTPLMAAVVRKCGAPMATLLLQAGADANLQYPEGCTSLHIAVDHDDRPAVEVLLAHGADPNLATPDGRTPLHIAVSRGDLEIMRILLEKGANLQARASTGTPLFLAISSEQKAAAVLLLHRGADPNISVARDVNALKLACLLGWADVVNLLLQKGASNSMGESDLTALHLAAGGRAAAQKWWSTSRELFRFGRLRPPPTLGSEADYQAVLTLLLASRPDVDARATDAELTPLFIAVQFGKAASVDALLTAGADVSARNAEGWTYLHLISGTEASASAVSNIVVRLLAAGARINAVGPNLFTPLHCAALWGRPDIIQVLLAAGADPNARTGDHKTALDLATASREPQLRPGVAAGRKECAELLRRAATELRIAAPGATGSGRRTNQVSMPTHIVIRSDQFGRGSFKSTGHTLVLSNGVYAAETYTVAPALISNLMAVAKRPWPKPSTNTWHGFAIDPANLGLNAAWVKSNYQRLLESYSDKSRREAFPNASERQRAWLTNALGDLELLGDGLRGCFAGFLTDDYPSLELRFENHDGQHVEQVFRLSTMAHLRFMLPWEVCDGSHEFTSGNADISRAVVQILPPGFLHGDRLDGDLFQVVLGGFVESQQVHAFIKKSTLEDTLGDEVDAPPQGVELRTCSISGRSYERYPDTFRATLHRTNWPERLTMAIESGIERGVVTNLKAILSRADARAAPLLKQQWLVSRVKGPGNVSLEVKPEGSLDQQWPRGQMAKAGLAAFYDRIQPALGRALGLLLREGPGRASEWAILEDGRILLYGFSGDGVLDWTPEELGLQGDQRLPRPSDVERAMALVLDWKHDQFGFVNRVGVFVGPQGTITAFVPSERK